MVIDVTYRVPCFWCTKMAHDAVITRCTLLLQLLSYDWFVILCPIINLSSYEQDLYYNAPED
jgi:hypothetical protein